MHLSGLFIYPVKSLRGLAVPSAQLDTRGLVGDRRFMIVDEHLKFMTQRTVPRMALIETELGSDRLILRNPHHGSAAVSLTAPGDPLRVEVWRDTVEAIDCGVEIATWLADFLRQPCRLVRLGETSHRPVTPAHARPGDEVTFADAYPLLAIGEASLADLNDRLAATGEARVPMDRFRPNLVIAGSAPYAEDTWSRFMVGNALFRAATLCSRCPVPNTDQRTAERGHEPLRTLATYRRDSVKPSDVNFGRNLIHETKSGSVQIGDAVTVVTTKAAPV